MGEVFGAVKDVAVGQLLAHLGRALPDQPALVYRHRVWSFAELEADCLHLARALLASGVARGDRVAVWAPNVPEWVLLQFALAKIGAILVTVNTALRSAELGYLLRQSGSRWLFTAPGFRELDYLAELDQAGEIESLEQVVVLDQEAASSRLSWPEVWERGFSGPDPTVEVDLDDVINMQYTSGTTGFPKGVRLSSRNILNNGYWLGQGLGYAPGDRLCLCVPLFHCFGCVIGVLAAYTHGVTLCPVESFEARRVLETIERERCTAVYGVPTMFLAQLEHPDFTHFDLTSLRTGVMAGSLCPEPLMRRVMAQMHLREITIVYGLTEASPAITQTPRFDSVELRTQTVGTVLPELEVRIVDPATMADCPPRVSGELIVRGYAVMEGYHDDPQATRAAIDPDGWLRTGDQATMDEQGYVRITGRLKDIIIRGGENIAPREVEDALRHHPAVLDVAVYGVKDAWYGEQVAASVRLRSGPPDPEPLQHYCREHLAHYKIPRYLRFVEEFPLTASGKIQKFRLRQAHEAELESYGGFEP